MVGKEDERGEEQGIIQGRPGFSQQALSSKLSRSLVVLAMEVGQFVG